MDLDSGRRIAWCPGCGNFGILAAFKRAVESLGVERERLVVVAGIGCHGRMVEYLEINGFHVLHGRVLPVATGVKLANPDLVVVGFSGDGDAYAIGMGHLPHAIRRNLDITLIVHDNAVYGLTTGQATPTTPAGARTRSTPLGNPEDPIDPVLMALSLKCSFVARGFAGDVGHLSRLMEEAIRHRGFALIDVLQPCVTFNDTWAYYRERVYRLEDEGHDPSDWGAAVERALETGDRIPIGVFYREERETLLDRMPWISGDPPVRVRVGDAKAALSLALSRV
ncbi:MAG: 2-oxoacid:ferredoxin oxidoreductase subunit beta [Thermoproteota archaeon]|nr:MAG: 2-oxoacid:ferredoxin oxidoreductase subunit beta [Candidatus Korarchaeota archaeon]